MIHARLSNGDFLFGIDAENVRRLRNGHPIVVDLTLMGGTDRFLIMYGETMQHVADELERMTGQKLPPVQPMPREGGPKQ